MSSSESRAAAKKRGSRRKQPLTDRVLLLIAERFGPLLDRVDVTDACEASIRDLVLELGAADAASPAEVRTAVMELVAADCLKGPVDDAEALAPDAKVALRLRGLVAARAIDPGCGRVVSKVTLVMKPGRSAGLFDARIVTEKPDLDRMLRKANLNLAAFYVLAVRKPSQKEPLLLSECPRLFTRMAHQGVGSRSGPGDRLHPSREAISAAIERMKDVVPLCGTQDNGDGRLTGWYLRAPFPEVLVVGATGKQYRDWAWMSFNLGQILEGKPIVDRRHERVAALSDDQLRAMEAAKEAQQG